MEFNYIITKELIRALLAIASLEERLKGLSLSPALRTSLYQDAKIRTSHFSSKIEGNCLTLKQTEDVFKQKHIQAPKRDIQEVKNLFDLFDFLIAESMHPEKITSKTICTLHRYVEKNIVKGRLLGRYREAQNAIFDSATSRVIYMPPETTDIPTLMDQFLNILSGSGWEHELIRSAVAHFGLVTIHPFMDGNGRTARALSTLLLMQSGFQFVRYMAWDEYFYLHRNQYYNLLHAAQGDNYYERNGRWDIQAWVEFFILGIEQTIGNFLEQIGATQQPAVLNVRQEKALRFMKRKGRITNREYRELNKVSNFTALSDLQSMEEQGLAERIGKGRAVQYLLKK
ncbi:MAG: Fic family protein [bacterium]